MNCRLPVNLRIERFDSPFRAMAGEQSCIVEVIEQEVGRSQSIAEGDPDSQVQPGILLGC